jgi:hypothetical protein
MWILPIRRTLEKVGICLVKILRPLGVRGDHVVSIAHDIDSEKRRLRENGVIDYPTHSLGRFRPSPHAMN